MDVERCLSSIGSFGLYQKLLSFVLVSYTSFLCAFNYYSQVWEFYLLQTVTSRLSLQILLFSVPPHERVNESLVRYDHSHLFPNIVSEVNHNFIISSNPEEFPVTFYFLICLSEWLGGRTGLDTDTDPHHLLGWQCSGLSHLGLL